MPRHRSRHRVLLPQLPDLCRGCRALLHGPQARRRREALGGLGHHFRSRLGGRDVKAAGADECGGRVCHLAAVAPEVDWVYE